MSATQHNPTLLYLSASHKNKASTGILESCKVQIFSFIIDLFDHMIQLYTFTW